MVRCGAVNHPSQWDWVDYHEIMDHRRPYRLLDTDRLLWRLKDPSLKKGQSRNSGIQTFRWDS